VNTLLDPVHHAATRHFCGYPGTGFILCSAVLR
jgi:hypothetical protein